MYDLTNNKYFGTSREDVLNLLEGKKFKAALEVGSGSAATLVEIKRRTIATEVCGVEQFAIPNSFQGNALIDYFHISTLNDALPLLPNNHFDLVIFADVLEHMIDPWAALRDILPKLTPNCQIVVSLPNIRHVSIFFKIFIKGRFEYDQEGILDRTHLRFFCKKDMIDLLTESGFNLETIYPSYDLWGKGSLRLLNRFTFRLFEQFITKQFILICKKN